MRKKDRQLHRAAEKGDAAACLALLKGGADANAIAIASGNNNWSALHYASVSGCADICQMLLRHGAHVQAVDDVGETPLHWAASRGRLEVCHILLEHGAGVNTLDTGNARNALGLAASRGHTDVCRLLLGRGANIQAVDGGGNSALHRTAWGNHPDTCLMLLEHGCDLLIKNAKNMTAQDVALFKKHEGCTHAIRCWVAAQAARAALQEMDSGNASKGNSP